LKILRLELRWLIIVYQLHSKPKSNLIQVKQQYRNLTALDKLEAKREPTGLKTRDRPPAMPGGLSIIIATLPWHEVPERSEDLESCSNREPVGRHIREMGDVGGGAAKVALGRQATVGHSVEAST